MNKPQNRTPGWRAEGSEIQLADGVEHHHSTRRLEDDHPLIGATVEPQLATVLVRMQTDEIGVDDLTPSLAGIFLLGHERGVQAILPMLTDMEAQRDQAEADADTFYERWRNPAKKLSEVRQRRIDQALEEADRRGELTSETDVVRIAVQAAAPERRAA